MHFDNLTHLAFSSLFALAILRKVEIQLGLFNKEFIANTTTYWISQSTGVPVGIGQEFEHLRKKNFKIKDMLY